MHTTPPMSLHYLVKHKYLKTNNIIQSLVVTASVGKFKEIPPLESLPIHSLQGVSIACYAKRCISYRLSVCLTV